MSDNKSLKTQMISELYDLILSLKTKEDCAILFEDLCTYKEVEQMAQRLRAAKLLISGCTYNKIIDAVVFKSTIWLFVFYLFYQFLGPFPLYFCLILN